MAGIDDSAQFANQGAKLIHDATTDFLDGVGIDRASNSKVSGWIASAIGSITAFVTYIFSGIFRVAAELAALYLGSIENVRSVNQDLLNDVLAGAISDVLGIEVSASDIPAKGTRVSQSQIATSVGGKVVSAITSLMGGTPASAPGPGQKAAEGFMGFGLNFAVNEGLLSLIGEIESLGFIKGFAEIPQSIRGAMGVSRLMRVALQPLLHALVTVPYTREMNSQYRPHQLSANEYLTAWLSARIPEQDARTQLGQLGFADDLVTEMFNQRKHKLKVHEIDALQRWGDITQDQALQMLRDDGIPVDVGTQLLRTLDLQRADHAEQAYAAEVLGLAKQRFIDPVTYSTLIQRLHFSPAEQQGWLNRLGVYLDSETKRLNLGEMLFLLEHNLLTTDQLDAWAAAEGYNQDTAAMLDLYLTQKTVDFDAAQKLKHDKALFQEQQKAASKKPVPPDIIHP